MADVIIEQPPFILIKPKLTIGATGSIVEFECNANEVDASPEQDSTDTETFCGIFTSYKPEKWTVTITALQSFGTDGLWNLLRPMANTLQPFTILPDATQPVSDSNPEMSGTAYVQGFAFLAAPVGEASEFDLVLAVQGVPDFSVIPGAMAAQTEGEGAPAEQTA
jgi:hypothetical protein